MKKKMSDNVWVPKGAKILDKICVISKEYYNNYKLIPGNDPHNITFSPKINERIIGALAVVDNIFSGPFKIGKISAYSASFYASLYMENVISSSIKVTFRTLLKYWEINEIIQSGVVGAGGNLDSNAEFVIVTYGGHFSPIIKGAPIYNKIMGI